MITVKDLNKKFGDNHVLKGIDFSLNKGDVVVILGPSGSGKTTIVLHRIAYLLYNYRDQLNNNILILGPNRLFMDYISDDCESFCKIKRAEDGKLSIAVDKC